MAQTAKVKKICVITDSRAEYGHLFWLMKEIQNDPGLELQVIVTGSHLSHEFGLTYQVIEKDGFPISDKIVMTLSTDHPSAMSKAMGLGCISLVDSLCHLKPDWVVLLGDRYEMLAAAITAYTLKIPIAHLHGGEVSFGAMDEAFRHSITKMSLLHFVSTERHRQRVIQLGETPERVFNFGAPGLDHCHRSELLTQTALQDFLQLDITSKTTAIVTYHPVTLETVSVEEQVDNLLKAIEDSGIQAVFTKANADTQGRIINQKIAQFVQVHPSRFKFIDNLGQVRYLSCLKHLNLMIGNSSSGIIEAGSFGRAVVNIGHRQKGREHGENVLQCGYALADIHKAIAKAVSSDFQKRVAHCQNPYEGASPGKISYQIKEALKGFMLRDDSLMKSFFDLPTQ